MIGVSIFFVDRREEGTSTNFDYRFTFDGNFSIKSSAGRREKLQVISYIGYKNKAILTETVTDRSIWQQCSDTEHWIKWWSFIVATVTSEKGKNVLLTRDTIRFSGKIEDAHYDESEL